MRQTPRAFASTRLVNAAIASVPECHFGHFKRSRRELSAPSGQEYLAVSSSVEQGEYSRGDGNTRARGLRGDVPAPVGKEFSHFLHPNYSRQGRARRNGCGLICGGRSWRAVMGRVSLGRGRGARRGHCDGQEEKLGVFAARGRPFIRCLGPERRTWRIDIEIGDGRAQIE